MKPPLHSRPSWNSPATSARDDGTASFPQQVRVDRTKPSPASSVSGPLSQSLSPFAASATTAATTATGATRSSKPSTTVRPSGRNSNHQPPRQKPNKALTFDSGSDADTEDDDDDGFNVRSQSVRHPPPPRPRPSFAASRPHPKPSGTAPRASFTQDKRLSLDSSSSDDDKKKSNGDDSDSDDDDFFVKSSSKPHASGARKAVVATAPVPPPGKLVAPTGEARWLLLNLPSSSSSSSSDDDDDSPAPRRPPATTTAAATTITTTNTTTAVSASSSTVAAKGAATAQVDALPRRSSQSVTKSRARAARTTRTSDEEESSNDDDDDDQKVVNDPDSDDEGDDDDGSAHSPRRGVASLSRPCGRMQTNPGRSHATNAEPATNATPADDGKQEDEEGREAQEAEPSPPLPSPRDEESKQKEKDEIWQSDDEDPVAPEKTNPMKKATAKKRAPSAKERAPAAKRAPASKSRGKSSDGMAKANHGDPVSSDDDDEDPAAAQLKLYPMLKKPVFGPYELEPLILEKNSDRPYQVPSSINRYLSDYQQEGIQFMFDKCAETKGAILGDDMGLGKTIQVIGLFAALLEKTGTKLDQIELKRRKKLVNKRVHEIRLAQEQALRAGSIFTPPDVPSEIGLPDWCPILVVVPKAVVKQWMEHLKNWGYFAAERFSNGKECELERARNGETEIVVCGVPQFSNADYADLLATVKWRLVVIDEFHKFKNEKTNGATNLRALRSKVEDLVVIGLTGTLMQNEHRELWNLIDLAQPGLLGTWSKFMIRVAQPITQGEKKDAAHDVKERGERVSALFKAETLPKVFLRRTKEEKLREFLPAKDEIVVFCELSKTQKEIYSYILKQPDFVLLSHANGPCDCSANDKVFREYKLMKTKAQRVDFMRRNKDRITRRCECHYRCPWDKSSPDGIAANAVLWRQVGDHGQPPCCCKSCPWCIGLPALSILYRLVSHVSLLQVDENPAILPRGSQDHIAATKELEKAKAFLPPKLVAEGKIPGGYFRAPALDQGEFCEMSGKLSVLKKLLKRIDNQHGRVLIFSAYTTVLDVIEAFLQVDLGCVYRRMDGKTSEKNRDKYKQEFKSNPNILAFLLSTKAMGLGLDLTEANNVIIFDVEWNPSWDAQAQDRAYRLGQTRDVKVYRLVARGTIEEMKYLRQNYKTQLTDQTITTTDEQSSNPPKKQFLGVAGDKDNKGELFGMANLLKFRDGTFMNYQSSASSSIKADNTIDQVVYDDFLACVRGMAEDEFHEIGDDPTAAMDALVKRRAGASKYDSYGDESYNYEEYGAESQVNMAIMDRVKVAFDSPTPDEGPTSRCSTGQHSSPRARDGEPYPSPDVVGSSKPAKETASKSDAEAPPKRKYYLHLPTKSKQRKVE